MICSEETPTGLLPWVGYTWDTQQLYRVRMCQCLANKVAVKIETWFDPFLGVQDQHAKPEIHCFLPKKAKQIDSIAVQNQRLYNNDRVHFISLIEACILNKNATIFSPEIS
ncbi:hypothetical protein DPMN_043116 [Dreissena polymorpha]|uniref:Uncharacterized protein n=1 Tax=Dreissena polymorpha TaxID=45954 RepID=A0A9D4D0R3_DREPO|nr:hypothetical protein DPMN_043116 [Dreissena polymorpha]